ncbi:unnamed protein product, partial [marine sediment metagenome]
LVAVENETVVYSPIAFRRGLTMSVLSHVKFLPLRPKCPSWAVSR